MKRAYFKPILFAALLLLTNILITSADQGVPMVGKCQVFPSNNPWNTDISQFPVHPNSDKLIAGIGLDRKLHPDFGWKQYGIPYRVVGADQPLVPVKIVWYPDESEKGPFPIPLDAKIEGDGVGDSHVLVVNEDTCKLYELYAAKRVGDGYEAGSAAVFDLNSNKLRTDGWPTPIGSKFGLTSADAAGLPILPGLIRYDEVAAGALNHAIRFTAKTTRKAWIYPATHQAGSTDSLDAPPMGLRVRMKADFDISAYTGESRVILEAMKKYGMMLADNGSNWFFQGALDDRWDDNDIDQLKKIPGSAFEAVDTSSMTPESVADSKPSIPQAKPPTPLPTAPQNQNGSFKDVTSSNPYFKAIEYVKAQGIVKGYAREIYKPTQTINRAEFIKIIVQAAFNYNIDNDTSSEKLSLSGLTFSDLTSGAWYNPYLRQAVQHKLISGYSDGTLRPEGKISYAEAAKIIVLAFGYKYGTNALWYRPFTDVLTMKKAMPSSIKDYSQKLTRGEMAEMIYRLKTL